jgi:dipeptidase E
MQLHLLSVPGEGDIRYILTACRPYLQAQAKPLVAYFPAASYTDNWLEYTVKAFSGLAEVGYMDSETMSLSALEAILDRAGALYISGGNTFLLNHRLHESGLYEGIRQRVLAGLPLVGFSAGTILCGPNILTTNDMNVFGHSHFAGLDLLPYNFDVHYPTDDARRARQDEWLEQYHEVYNNPLLLLEDSAYLFVDSEQVVLRQGVCWVLEKGQKRRLMTTALPSSLLSTPR